LFSLSTGLIRLQELVNAQQGKNRQITIRKLEGKNADFRPIFKEMKKQNEYKIILDCSTSMIEPVLRQVGCILISSPLVSHRNDLAAIEQGTFRNRRCYSNETWCEDTFGQYAQRFFIFAI
jgi:hypothetical protein